MGAMSIVLCVNKGDDDEKKLENRASLRMHGVCLEISNHSWGERTQQEIQISRTRFFAAFPHTFHLLFSFFFVHRRWISRYDCRISDQVSFEVIVCGAISNLHKWSKLPFHLFASTNKRGLRSKRIKRIEHNLALNLKTTQKKIWNGVTKDVGYLRNILNEVYFLKFKVS